METGEGGGGWPRVRGRATGRVAVFCEPVETLKERAQHLHGMKGPSNVIDGVNEPISSGADACSQ